VLVVEGQRMEQNQPLGDGVVAKVLKLVNWSDELLAGASSRAWARSG
jgi:hypothetical protein